MWLIDTHAHLDQPEFDADREEVLARALAAGVATIVAIGSTADSSAACVELAEEHPAVFAAVGIQPNYCAQAAPGDWERIVQLARHPRVVALGETGLDRHWNYSPFELQQDYFDRHLELARQRGLPVVIHTRESDADVVAMLREAARAAAGQVAGVMHSFTGTAETATGCIGLGLAISFAGMVTFKKSDALRAVAAAVPDDRIVIETDSPYLAPHPLRGQRNEPANLVYTATLLAQTRGVDATTFARQTTENATRLFKLPSG